ncbi:putative conserved lipoprotein LpqG [Streptosporangium violaceochromogenes]|nr:putative conserved lipoprotein LpqG [Streptosporangium violaceochromogenes]
MAATALVTAVMFGGAAFADSGSRLTEVIVDEGQSRVTVVGEGSLSAKPDVMRLSAGVEVRRPAAGQAFADARGAAARLTAALLAAGIDARDLQTSELSLGPEYDNHPKVSGYRAVQGVEAVVRDIEAADRVIDAAAAVGEEVRLNGISFEVSDNREVLVAARKAAFKDARARAEQYARLSGRVLGAVVTIGEEGVTPPRPMAYGAGLMADKASISPGRQAVSVTVRVVYELR